MIILGISALYHDSACAVMADGQVVSAAQEERFSRRRFDPAMPVRAVRACLRDAGLSIADVDHVAYYERPERKLARQLWMGLPELPETSPSALFRLDADRPFRQIEELLGFTGPVTAVGHHEAHAASAFYQSGFATSALFTADAVGEWTTTSYGRGGPEGVELREEVAFPHSLGLFYSAVTSYLGFAVNSDEYKVMGLAPYGSPRYADRLARLVRDEDGDGGGRFRLDLDYFDFSGRGPMYTERLAELLEEPAREPESEISRFHTDVASSLQEVLENVLLRKLRHLHRETGESRLGYAGGVALNCVANRRIREEGPFEEIFVQPAAGDSGGAIGAAAMVHHELTGEFAPRRLTDAKLGPPGATRGAPGWLRRAGVPYTDFTGDERALLERTADLLADGAVIGWYQGRMEFGPRALGARSILADPRDPGMRDRINALVKKREAFRPFAPAVVEERCAEFFELDGPSPFMLDTATVRQGAELPAITHVDGSARVQTVSSAQDRRFHGLLTAFAQRTGFPILLNTSFNMRGEPIVAQPADALVCFVRSDLDVLVLGDHMVLREDIPGHWAARLEELLPYRKPPISRDVYSFL
ncbi:carbamoyltransferase family protein [Streptomyces marispadix]|uniref:Carbamoyltransferase n=1 Tax=Streptomyces marispadix TaxID=2922868 RepID=A0ABS9SZC7_9ACTN|nr:carbamoyltransferase C-terminal domain-containing protein [Streptomyces marispadix]MCH6161602.1 carbamoyltransferase [Streptomyces marispadix]